MTMWEPSASAPWCSQHSLPVAYPHNGAVPHRERDFIDTTRHSSMYYGSNQQSAFSPPSDPARNQRPGSTFFGQLPPAQIHRPHFQSHLSREQAALSPSRHLRVAPGENPHANQTPGTYAGHAIRHGTHHQNRSRGPYPSHVFHRQQNVGNRQVYPHSNALHAWHEVATWPNGDNELVPQMAWPPQAAAPAPPQGPHINEAAAMLINGTPVVLPEATSLELSPGTQPAGTPTLCMEASPSASQSATGPCPDPTCNPNQTWCRKQELERHVLGHLPHHLYCPHLCSWRGSRRYALKEHYKRKHPNDQAPDYGAPEAFTIYDAKLLAKRIVNEEITIASAIKEVDTMVQKKVQKKVEWDA